jgi:hypothetical protein
MGSFMQKFNHGGKVMPWVSINYLAVFVSAFVPMILGALWYSPLLFGKRWISLIGFKEEDIEGMKGGVWKTYFFSFLCYLVMGYVLAHIVDFAQAKTPIEGVQSGIWVWLGFVATTHLMPVLYEKKPGGLYLILASYHLVSLILMGIILAVWV